MLLRRAVRRSIASESVYCLEVTYVWRLQAFAHQCVSSVKKKSGVDQIVSRCFFL
jgi:hypothetical protein